MASETSALRSEMLVGSASSDNEFARPKGSKQTKMLLLVLLTAVVVLVPTITLIAISGKRICARARENQ